MWAGLILFGAGLMAVVAASHARATGAAPEKVLPLYILAGIWGIGGGVLVALTTIH